MLILVGFVGTSSHRLHDSKLHAEYHYLEDFLGFCMCELSIVDECVGVITKRMNTFI